MSKLPNVGTTIFTTMSKLAIENNAINLSQGFPNFPVDPVLTSILEENASGNTHQYAPMQGNSMLLSEVSKLIKRSYGRTVSENHETLITAGATQAIFTTLMALIYNGDEVVILDPSYDCYEPSVILAGGKPIRVSLDNEFLPDWEQINNAVNSKTKLIITNNPHNPSGRTWQESDIQQLERISGKHPQLLILSDEVYEYITFENKHISVHSRPKLIDRSIVVSSFGKTFHITGWKIGYLVAPKRLITEIKKVHQFNVFSVNSVAQQSLADYLTVTDVTTLGPFYQQKRDLFRQLMAKSKFKLLPCEGTYFQTADYSQISNEDDTLFCERLTKEHGVASIPISVFNNDPKATKIIRFCFAKDEETLTKAAELLCKI
ncbi:MAG: methionine aminotransferase [Crocinitomicaceae bacterium]